MAGPRVREPRQERSRLRVGRLIDAAERILARDGYDGLTMHRLARAARVPVGTFYQFFDDKDAIVEVLAQRYVALTARLIEDHTEEILGLPPGARLAAAYEAFVELYRTNPGYRAVRAARYTSPALERADNANVDAAVEGVRRILTAGTRIRDGARVRSASRTLQLLFDALLYRAGELRAQDVDAFIPEAKSTLSALENDAISRLSKDA